MKKGKIEKKLEQHKVTTTACFSNDGSMIAFSSEK